MRVALTAEWRGMRCAREGRVFVADGLTYFNRSRYSRLTVHIELYISRLTGNDVILQRMLGVDGLDTSQWQAVLSVCFKSCTAQK